mmetsp:Transcript_31517/g.72184  ORF Transcript_31517/g.72184 Transcript_31517/m.72184 type:complete len:224 (-) Transcript_31517:622-1293(-)
MGGKVIDKLGGYKDDTGEAVVLILKVCCGFAFCAAAFAVPSVLFTNFWAVLAMIWFLLFFGGALLPAATGISIAAVPSDLRALSTSVAMFTYHLLGYAAGPYVMGAISTYIGGKEGLKYGFRFNQAVAVVTMFFFIGAYFSAKGKLTKNEHILDEMCDEVFLAVEIEDKIVTQLPNDAATPKEERRRLSRRLSSRHLRRGSFLEDRYYKIFAPICAIDLFSFY